MFVAISVYIIIGPFTEEIATDFWLMIWQQNPSAIIMVTKAVEYDKVVMINF